MDRGSTNLTENQTAFDVGAQSIILYTHCKLRCMMLQLHLHNE
jgi:hypothetical protein